MTTIPVPIRAAMCVDARHPSLPGHFPDNPIIPGVVLLDHVAAMLESAGAGSFNRIAAVKFLAPMLPGEAAEIIAIRDGSRVRFRIERDGVPILTGDGELA